MGHNRIENDLSAVTLRSRLAVAAETGSSWMTDKPNAAPPAESSCLLAGDPRHRLHQLSPPTSSPFDSRSIGGVDVVALVVAKQHGPPAQQEGRIDDDFRNFQQWGWPQVAGLDAGNQQSAGGFKKAA
jgi:hypothetical protein